MVTRCTPNARWHLAYLLLGVLLFTLPVYSQISVKSSAPQIVVRQNAPWIAGVNGLGNIYNVYVAANTTGLCLQFDNLDSVSHTLTLGAFISSDQTPSTGPGGASGVVGQSVQISPASAGSVTITTGASSKFYIPVSGSSFAQVTVTVGGAAGTNNAGNFSIAQLQYPANGCPEVFGSQVTPAVMFPCNTSITAQVGTASTSKLVNLSGIKAGASVHVCSYQLSIGGAAVTAASNLFVAGTGATCGTGTTSLWRIRSGTTTAQNFALASAAQSELFETPAGLDLCYTDAGTTAGTEVSVSFAIY
jgi:hypothetical protein